MRWSARDVADALRVPYRTLMSWIEKGLFRPENYDGRRGKPVAFSEKDVRELLVYRILRDHFSAQELGAMMASLRGIGHNPFSQGEFVIVSRGDGTPLTVQKVHGGKILEYDRKNKAFEYRLFPVTEEGLRIETLIRRRQDGEPVVSRATAEV